VLHIRFSSVSLSLLLHRRLRCPVLALSHVGIDSYELMSSYLSKVSGSPPFRLRLAMYGLLAIGWGTLLYPGNDVFEPYRGKRRRAPKVGL
jgi:hypothetical protein